VDTTAPPLGDWRPGSTALTAWVPEFTPPRAAIASTYVRADESAGLYVAMYYDQDRDSKLVSSANQLIRTTNHSGFIVSTKQRTLDLGNVAVDVQESVLRVANRRFIARTWYWIDGEVMASPIRAKIVQARARLRGRGDAGAIVVVYALLPDEATTSIALDDLTRQAAATLPGVLAHRLRVSAR
jgi:EpsI family protein